MDRTKKKAELLAPAGSFDVFRAVIAAGADAVYMGLPKFSARAYAENAKGETYADAIRYAHLHGKKLYCTINTLLKEPELQDELYETVRPLYEAGLDGVIVQDLGEMRFLHEHFPGLPLHASTQATVVSSGAADYLKPLGVSRIVPARELSLSEIRELSEGSGLEIECFIHGALCYSYSGQCLFSSIAGGRSGNRGRCAQPCRLNYSVKDEKGGYVSSRQEPCLLSLKDLNTLKMLPEMLEAGVYSLKIEGRMKKAEYAAGVTSIYRKYLDRCLSGVSKEDYRVDPEDEARLFDLFNRQGFTDGYLKKENGRDMLTLVEPSFREHDNEFIGSVRARFIEKEHKTPIRGEYTFEAGKPYRLKISVSLDGREDAFEFSDSGFVAETAENRSATKEEVEKQLLKLGDTDFTWESLEGTLGDGLFLPVSKLNAFRREAVSRLTERILRKYERMCEGNPEESLGKPVQNGKGLDNVTPDSVAEIRAAEGEAAPATEPGHPAMTPVLAVTVRTKEQFMAALSLKLPLRIELESVACEADEYGTFVEKTHEAGKTVFLRLPQVFRARARAFFETHRAEIFSAGFDGILVRDLEELSYAEKSGFRGEIVSDHNLYAFNSVAAKTLQSFGVDSVTAPLELNGHELREAGLLSSPSEIVVYGRAPMMVSANCIYKTLKQCRKAESLRNREAASDRREPEALGSLRERGAGFGRVERETPKYWTLIDRMGNEMPVVNDCRYCMNTIYNALPTSLLSDADKLRGTGIQAFRLELSVETGAETRELIERFYRTFILGEKPSPGGLEAIGKTTHGHFRRGVE